MIIVIPENIQKEIENAKNQGLKVDFYFLKDKKKPAEASNIGFIRTVNDEDFYYVAEHRVLNADDYARLRQEELHMSTTNDYGDVEDDLFSDYALVVECEKKD